VVSLRKMSGECEVLPGPVAVVWHSDLLANVMQSPSHRTKDSFRCFRSKIDPSEKLWRRFTAVLVVATARKIESKRNAPVARAN
jgi:hypothetical protein